MRLECLCIGCGLIHQLVQCETTQKPLDDGEFEVVTNCNCTECGEALVVRSNPDEEDPPELYG